MELEKSSKDVDWASAVLEAFRRQSVRFVSYVPDAGLTRLIELCHGDRTLTTLPLTTEEEGVGLAMGAWLGGERSALLLQSSGVGNLVNALGAVAECRIPLFLLITMRGEEGESNPWQIPMGRAVPSVLEAMGVRVERVGDAEAVGTVVEAVLSEVFSESSAVAVLISQSLIGIKTFQEGRRG